MIVYMIKNLLNNKVYIGKTRKSLKERIRQHKSSAKSGRSNCAIHKAISKYGWENFEFSVLAKDLDSIEKLNKTEMDFIQKFNSTSNDFGYNFTLGGDGGAGTFGHKNAMFGKKRPDLSALNISRKGIPLSNERKLEISKTHLGSKRTDIAKKKMSEKRKKAWQEGRYDSSKFGQHTIGVSPVWVTVKVKIVELDMVFDSISLAAKYISGYPGNISSVLAGRLKRYKGYTFERVV